MFLDFCRQYRGVMNSWVMRSHTHLISPISRNSWISWVGRAHSSFHRIHGIHEFLGGEVTHLISLISRNSWIPGWGGHTPHFIYLTEFMNSQVGRTHSSFHRFQWIHQFLGGEVTQLISPIPRNSRNSWDPGWGGHTAQFTEFREFTEFMYSWLGWMGRLRDMDIYVNGLYDYQMIKRDLNRTHRQTK